MSRLVKDVRDSSHSRSVPEGATAAASAGPASSASGGNSPMSGNKIVKTWRVMGDRTRSKTKDILKRWQTMNNGQTSEDSLGGLDEFSDISGSTDSERGHRGKKGTWSVHVWSKYCTTFFSSLPRVTCV
ncbi:hypothetical protein Pmani_020592 [Petrolisthes manimaculis]|uniref:Uncharacterized protein n=1 Tax=Petrolisthes manimaculis TaxID=1843537 RepID=A0AAE1U6E9_9EUCA|nr:hypothetical protein Pmani_020592 [Petrolisthes manimaculis]